MHMNVVEAILTAILVAVAAMAVVKYVRRSLRAEEPDCGGCEGCPSHAKQDCCAVAHREDGK